MMSMVELFYGENEPIWVIGNSRQPVSPYTQPIRDYMNPSYTDTHYAYMQPARDHEVRAAHAGRHQFNPYMQPARDHGVRGYTGRQQVNPYMRASAPPAHELVPSNHTDRRIVNPYVQSAACDEVTGYGNRHHTPSPYMMPYSTRHEVPTTYTENSWPQQYPMMSNTPASNLSQQLPLNNQTAAPTRFQNPPSLQLKVPLCCERCEERVKESLLDMDGVEGVLCDQTNQRVTVEGNVQPQRVLKRVKKIKKRSDFWLRDLRVLQQQQQQQQGLDSF